MYAKRRFQGFTLIELLVVVAIIALLATVVIVALRPTVRFSEARNSRRIGDVNSILTAVHQYIVDNGGTLPPGVSTSLQQLGTCGSGGGAACAGAAGACLNLSSELALYLKTMPEDPTVGSPATTGYSIVADSNNIITIAACAAELDAVIEVSR